MSALKIGETVYTVQKISKFLATVSQGQVVTCSDVTACVTDGKHIWFVLADRVYGTFEEAFAAKKKIENEA